MASQTEMSATTDRPAAAADATSTELTELASTLLRRGSTPLAFRLTSPDGASVLVGEGEPVLDVRLARPAGYAAVRSGSELAIAEAYLRSDLDLDGDLVRGMGLRALLRDDDWVRQAWSVIEPALRGRRRSNPQSVAKHYDSGNIQLFAADGNWHTYTPGIYLDAGEPLETAAERKLEAAFRALDLRPRSRLLDVGCGWGGFLRYCAARGVEASGITLSQNQLAYTRAALERDGLAARVGYADFFTFAPEQRFDAISLMGVLEDLSDYRFVMRRLRELLVPDGRVYLDFAAVARRFQVSAFIAQYIWPGAFRMVYLPQFVRAVDASGLEIVSVENDRHNYYLWAKKLHDRWVERHDEVVEASDERTYRMMRVLFAGTSWIMSTVSARATAYRVVLRARRDDAVLGDLTATTRRRALARVGDAVPHLLRRML